MLDELQALRLLVDTELHEREKSDEGIADNFLQLQRTFQRCLLESMDEKKYIADSLCAGD